MRCNLSKLLTIGVFCALFIFFGLNGSPAGAFSSGPLASRAGAPALGSFPQEANCTACHAGAANSGGGALTITAPANYSPNQIDTVSPGLFSANANGQGVSDWIRPTS